jgi:phenylpropionate dioxygenase-like ring-hydroxylating dioxygenase large terminal subunit
VIEGSSSAGVTARGAPLASLARRCWHAVATVDELRSAVPSPLAVTLLGERIAVAELTGPQPKIVAFADRCPHRSARLSLGTVVDDAVEGGTLRCAYHGWTYGADGGCVAIPSAPDLPVPDRARATAYEVQVEYGLVWVRLEAGWPTVIPACPGWDEVGTRMVAGEPYELATSAERRVENLVDLSHFAWVHDGSLGDRSRPVPPIPELRRARGELRFDYDPPPLAFDPDPRALTGWSSYRMGMPFTVDIAFGHPAGSALAGAGVASRLWFTVTPTSSVTCRTFWFIGRTTDLEGDDEPYLRFQQQILDEDRPIVESSDPAEIELSGSQESSVRTDRVSIQYRRWLRELVACETPDDLAETLLLPPLRAATFARTDEHLKVT